MWATDGQEHPQVPQKRLHGILDQGCSDDQVACSQNEQNKLSCRTKASWAGAALMITLAAARPRGDVLRHQRRALKSVQLQGTGPFRMCGSSSPMECPTNVIRPSRLVLPSTFDAAV